VVVSNTQPDGAGKFGRGIGIQANPETKERADVTVRASLVDHNHEVGVFVSGSDATLEGVVVSNTQPDGAGKFGRGIGIQGNPETKARAAVSLRDVLIADNTEAGIFVIGADATIARTRIRGTLENSDGKFGDGVAGLSPEEEWPAIVSITESEILDSARAGVSSFGATVVVIESELYCNLFDLDGEKYEGAPFSFDGSRNNRCGCEAQSEDCRAVSAQLEPPPLSEPLPSGPEPREP
jgi:hypothetical protein